MKWSIVCGCVVLGSRWNSTSVFNLDLPPVRRAKPSVTIGIRKSGVSRVSHCASSRKDRVVVECLVGVSYPCICYQIYTDVIINICWCAHLGCTHTRAHTHTHAHARKQRPRASKVRTRVKIWLEGRLPLYPPSSELQVHFHMWHSQRFLASLVKPKLPNSMMPLL